MPSQGINIAIAIGIAATATGILFYSTRKKPKRPARASDKRKLRGFEKKIYQQAQSLIASSPKSASQLLESIQLYREAIDVLENSGHIREAANTLSRMGRPNRAAIVFKRHSYWKEAAQAFMKANMPRDVAEMARNAGDINLAVKYYSMVKDYSMAAECYLDLGDYAQAAKMYLAADQNDKAINLYPTILENISDITLLQFSDQELSLIKKHMLSESPNIVLADILASQNQLADIIHSLTMKGDIKMASACYHRSPIDIGPELLANDKLSHEENIHLADLFNSVSSFEYAGIVLERINEFEKSAIAFEKAEIWDRAAYCYDRSGNKAMALEMRCKVDTPRVDGAPPPVKSETNPFVIDLTTSDTPLGGRPTIEQQPKPLLDHNLNHFQGQDDATLITDHMPEPPRIPSPQEKENAEPAPDYLILSQKEHPSFLNAKFIEDLNADQKKALWISGSSKHYQDSDIILDFGSDPSGIYFILEGNVDCYRFVHGHEQLQDTMSPPSSFGEFWLLIEQPTEVKFIANKSVLVHQIPRDQFHDLLDRNGSIARLLYKRFTKRLLARLINNRNLSGNK